MQYSAAMLLRIGLQSSALWAMPRWYVVRWAWVVAVVTARHGRLSAAVARPKPLVRSSSPTADRLFGQTLPFLPWTISTAAALHVAFNGRFLCRHCQEEALKYAAEAKRLEQEVQSLRVSCRAALRRAAPQCFA